jgi:hypothetical protein
MQPGFEAVMIGRDEHEHHAVRGTLPGGELGVLFPEWATVDIDGAGHPTTLPDPDACSTPGDRLDSLDMWVQRDPTGLIGRCKPRPPVRPAESWNLGRNAVLPPVRPGVPAPVDGVAERDAKLRRHVAGDYAAFHAYRRGGAADVGDVDGLLAGAAAPARERGLMG